MYMRARGIHGRPRVSVALLRATKYHLFDKIPSAFGLHTVWTKTLSHEQTVCLINE